MNALSHDVALYAQLRGATIIGTVISVDSPYDLWPVLIVKTIHKGTLHLTVSSDSEGNSPGTLAGLPSPLPSLVTTARDILQSATPSNYFLTQDTDITWYQATARFPHFELSGNGPTQDEAEQKLRQLFQEFNIPCPDTFSYSDL